jgi:hypothetical protein
LLGTGDLLEYGVPAPEEDEQGFRLDSEYRKCYKPEDAASMSDVSTSSLARMSLDFQDREHMKGCHLGFPDYRRRWENQNSIRGGEFGWNKGKNLGREYFLEAVRRLPKLRHLEYSDYRSLAMNGESYAQLCRRLFGITVCPNWSWSDDGVEKRFHNFLDDLSHCRGVWDSLSIGRHPFETNYHDIEDKRFWSDNSGQKPVIMTHETMFGLLVDGRSERLPQLPVRFLRLPMLIGGHYALNESAGLLHLATSALVELDLATADYHLYHDKMEHNNPTRPNYEDRSDMAKGFRYQLLHPNHTPDLDQLRSLTLRGFIMDTDCLLCILQDQLSALRTLRLINCYCMDNHDRFVAAMEQEIGPFSELTAVEIFGMRFDIAEGETTDHEYVQEYREKMQNRHASEYERSLKKGDEFKGLLKSDWPYVRPGLEAAMLGGKVNNVLRTTFAAPNDEARWHWYDLPNAGV